MKKLALLYSIIFCCSVAFAQFKVKFVVNEQVPAHEPVYIVGSFNNWDPGEKNHQLSGKDGKFQIDVRMAQGHHEYKFTRGSWATVETTEAGLDINNRVVNIYKDTTIKIVIEGWMDKFRDISKLPDTTQWQVAYNRSFFYLEKNLDSSYKYAQQANIWAQKFDHPKYEAAMARIFGRVMQNQGNHQKALEYYLKQLSIVEERKDTMAIAFCLLDLGNLFLGIKEYEKAKNYYLRVTRFNPLKAHAYGHGAPILALVRIGKIYYNTDIPDSAKFYASRAYQLALEYIDRRSQSESLTLMGNVLVDEGKLEEATKYYRLAIEQGRLYNSSSIIAENYQRIAKAFYRNGQIDSSFSYAKQAFILATELKNPFINGDVSGLLVTLFKNAGNTDSAFKYLENVVAAKDSLYNQDKNQQLQTMLFNEELQKQEHESNQQKFRARLKIYALAGGIVLLLLLCIALWQNNRRKQNINALLNQRGEKIEKTLAELEATQSQLIQKEKMASLGELTAGIAHEIQNPLNFINNFSEVSIEIATELKDEISAIDPPFEQKANLLSIAEDLVQNQTKIREHGQRADAIVKGMLHHSRSTSGERELININILANEFLQLSYHGLRAKDKTFNATFKTDFDESIQKITVVPQNIGRVLLNLFNNAFYSVSEKKKKLDDNYQPTVWVSTKKRINGVEISVKDNGLGIPQNIINKIFQPFYTTKPSGHGTGLGLSLSYDIITKEHGGTLNVQTKEGEYAEFILFLPV